MNMKGLNTAASLVPTMDAYYCSPFEPEMGKHPDLMVGPPTPTIFPTIGRNFEIS